MSFPFPLAPALAATDAEDKTQDEGEPPAKGKSASSPPGRQSRSSAKVIDISALPPALSLLQDPGTAHAHATPHDTYAHTVNTRHTHAHTAHTAHALTLNDLGGFCRQCAEHQL
jgi:hypothetical protein